MSDGGCALQRGDKVTNIKTHQTGTVIGSDNRVVQVAGGDGQPAEWPHADVIWAEGGVNEP